MDEFPAVTGEGEIYNCHGLRTENHLSCPLCLCCRERERLDQVFTT